MNPLRDRFFPPDPAPRRAASRVRCAALAVAVVCTAGALGTALRVRAEPERRPLAQRLAAPFPPAGAPDPAPSALGPGACAAEPALAELLKGSPYEKAVAHALEAAAGNGAAVAAALRACPRAALPDFLRSLAGADRLDLLAFETEAALEHLAWARRARAEAALPEVDDDLFHEAVLPARFTPYDFPEPWRREVYERFAPLRAWNRPASAAVPAGWDPAAAADSDPARTLDLPATVQRVNRWVAENCRATVVKRYFEAPPSPRAVLRARAGSATDLAVALAGILRALGVPARLHPELRWVEVRQHGRWVQVYPLDPLRIGEAPAAADDRTAAGAPGTVRLRLQNRGIPVRSPVSVALSRWQAGAWEPLNDRPGLLRFEESPEGLSIVAPPGDYLLTAGLRGASGDAHLFARQITLGPAATLVLFADLDVPLGELADRVRLARALPELPDLAPLDAAGTPHPLRRLAESGPACVFFFSRLDEPSRRMRPLVAEFFAANRLPPVALLGVDLTPAAGAADPGAGAPDAGDPAFPVLSDPERRIAAAFGLPAGGAPGLPGAALPSILLLARGGRPVLWVEGYDMNVKAVLVEAVGLLERE
ncbi:MAG: transglutaminase domain-containing protein [Planctomycetes bacterium]|nr:transglutaminase domain-containing protein [Planctomycetota bacterium]